MKRRYLLVGLLALALASYVIARAQTSDKNSIELGNTVLRLGMSKDSVVAVLAGYYAVDDSGWVITKSGPPYDYAGQVVFKNGKLVAVWKNWSPDNQQHGYELANNLYGLFKVLEDEGRTNCTLSTGTKQTSASEQKTAFLLCGGKEIQISTLRMSQGDQTKESAMLTEILKLRE
jgi:hypothetical protein